MNYLENLNEKQKQVVQTTEGPVLVVAGAGAGKTKAITHRIAHLVSQNVHPSQILAITFTNKAASEMRQRVEDLLGKDSQFNFPIQNTERPFIGTFHALGIHILKEQSKHLGIPRRFSIFDRDDSRRAVKEALKKLDLDPKEHDPKKILGAISREKGRGETVENFKEKRKDYLGEIIGNVWHHYQSILKKEKAFDFDDLLVEPYLLLKKNEDIRSYYQKIWKYLHVDEYQDTNTVQYKLVKLLSLAHKNICVVGDADQNIYTWRGAELKHILNFEKDFPNTTTILLEENYRSTKTIIGAANDVIAQNIHRKEKTLFTNNDDGEKITLLETYTAHDEAREIVSRIQQLLKDGVPPNQIAILYRANYQSRIFEEVFLQQQVPYQILGTRFFDRKEIKDILSYLRASFNPEALSDIKRIINYPARGVGKVTLLAVLEGNIEKLPAKTQEKIRHFYAVLEKIKTFAKKNKTSETIKYVFTESGIKDYLSKSKSEEDNDRIANIEELVTLATTYDALPPEEGVEALLENAALASDQDDLAKDEGGVKLMTVHASKGLEFDYVCVSGLEEGLFPQQRDDSQTAEESEEERRLFYVAITRAKKKVILSHAQIRTIFGSQQLQTPSQFLSDIDPAHIEQEQQNPIGENDIDEQRRAGIRGIFDIEF